ncbi:MULTISPECIES: hypothetical protein [Streptomyces violaceusniger group]|uniref:Uncharacterized protein n=2 Tax=Streptomyces javensis TaxID=114698 RepID=A0ABS0RG03_9ACTN|nr:hypothetical protein [Streptomyces javensis]MBI0315819.1 hypothetical protein [Streptomyces javensis]
MRAADSTARPGRLVWMDMDLWKGRVKERAEDDGMARARSRILEALLTSYAEGTLDAPVPAGSTFGTAERGGCRAYLDENVCERAEDRWKRQERDRRGGDPGFGLLCEVLLREYAEGRVALRITAAPSGGTGSVAA